MLWIQMHVPLVMVAGYTNPEGCSLLWPLLEVLMSEASLQSCNESANKRDERFTGWCLLRHPSTETAEQDDQHRLHVF